MPYKKTNNTAYYLRYKKGLTRLVYLTCLLGLFIDGYLLYISSMTGPIIKHIFHPTAFTLGLLQAAALLGVAIGAIIFGRLCDKVGRKKMLMFNLYSPRLASVPYRKV